MELFILLISTVPLGVAAIVAAKHEDELIEWEDRQIEKIRKRVRGNE